MTNSVKYFQPFSLRNTSSSNHFFLREQWTWLNLWQHARWQDPSLCIPDQDSFRNGLSAWQPRGNGQNMILWTSCYWIWAKMYYFTFLLSHLSLGFPLRSAQHRGFGLCFQISLWTHFRTCNDVRLGFEQLYSMWDYGNDGLYNCSHLIPASLSHVSSLRAKGEIVLTGLIDVRGREVDGSQLGAGQVEVMEVWSVLEKSRQVVC